MRSQSSFRQLLFSAIIIGLFVGSGGVARAATVTFEPGAGVIDIPGNTWTEAGVTVQVSVFCSCIAEHIDSFFFPGLGVGGSVGYFSGGGGLTSNAYTDFTIPGHTFSLDGFFFAGGGDNVLQGYDSLGNVIAQVHLTGGAHTFVPSELTQFVNLTFVRYCSFCITPQFNGNWIDNLDFENIQRVDANATPLPGALPLFVSGVGIIGLIARRRRNAAAHSAS
jgi:hypothetical protein